MLILRFLRLRVTQINSKHVTSIKSVVRNITFIYDVSKMVKPQSSNPTQSFIAVNKLILPLGSLD